MATRENTGPRSQRPGPRAPRSADPLPDDTDQLNSDTGPVRTGRTSFRTGRANAALPDTGEKHGEVTNCFGFGGGESGRERQLVDAGVRDQAGEFGEQRGVCEDRRGEKASGGSRAAGSR